MESTTGTIRAINGTHVSVTVDAPLACKRCASGKGCGAGLLLQGTSTPRVLDMHVPPGTRVSVGDEIRLSIAPAYLLKAAFLAYALPLIAVLLALAAGLLLTDTLGDSMAMLLALAGLVAGLFLSRKLMQNRALCEQFVPQFSRLDQTGEY